jgi:hypothetical protein
MRRYHLFEFEDQPWLPDVLRSYITDILAHQINSWGIYDAIVPLLREALEATGTPDILDLCSGSGGPVVRVRQRLAEEGCKVKVTLSDKYPNLQAFHVARTAGEDGIDYIAESIDATDVPSTQAGFRTLFTALHHFQPEAARRILADAVAKGVGIGVFELSQRSVAEVAMNAFSPTSVLLMTPFIKPLRWHRLLLTYAVPLIPALYFWEGLVSTLRCYTISELEDMVRSVGADHYRWLIGTTPHATMPVQYSYVIGYPVRR